MAKQVLIADDSIIMRDLIKQSLKSIPWIGECWEAANGLEAVERALESRPDLIVLDLAMPEVGGLEAARILKQRMPEVPIVLFTLYSIAACGEDSRIDAVVSKPEGLRRLRECVHRLLAPR